jgi:hypothetical protein
MVLLELVEVLKLELLNRIIWHRWTNRQLQDNMLEEMTNILKESIMKTLDIIVLLVEEENLLRSMSFLK